MIGIFNVCLAPGLRAFENQKFIDIHYGAVDRNLELRCTQLRDIIIKWLLCYKWLACANGVLDTWLVCSNCLGMYVCGLDVHMCRCRLIYDVMACVQVRVC